MHKILLNIILISLVSFANNSFGKEPLNALQTVDDFYKKRLNFNYQQNPGTPPPTIGFSKSFKAALAKNAEVCKNYATEICGFAAEGDEYLDAQEYDSLLNYKNSGIKFREVSKNTIEVKLNVYPSDPEGTDYYARTIIFVMIKEGESWVADDILYGKENSSREFIEKENAYYIANPDPDSIMAKINKPKQK